MVGVDAIALHNVFCQCRCVGHGLRLDVVAAVGTLAAAHLDTDAVVIAALGMPVRPRAAVPRRVVLVHGLHHAILVYKIVRASLQAAHAVIVITVILCRVAVVGRVVHHDVLHRLRAPDAVIARITGHLCDRHSYSSFKSLVYSFSSIILPRLQR